MRIHFKPFPVLTLCSILALGVLLWLGNWQLQRYEWKTALIAQIEERPKLPPMPLEELLARTDRLDDAEFRTVTVTGAFDHEHELHMFGHRGPGRAGYFVFTPLIRDMGGPVFINRGLVPLDKKDPASRPESLTEGRITVTGVLRLEEERRRFVPGHDLKNNVFYWRDLSGMAAAADLGAVAPVFVDAAEGNEALIGIPNALPKLKNTHMEYALTWFGIAAGLVILYGVFHTSHGRLRIEL